MGDIYSQDAYWAMIGCIKEEYEELKQNGFGWFLNTPLWTEWGKPLHYADRG